MPTDRDQEVHREPLIDHIRELEGDPQHGDEKAHVEKQQQGLKQIV